MYYWRVPRPESEEGGDDYGEGEGEGVWGGRREEEEKEDILNNA